MRFKVAIGWKPTRHPARYPINPMLWRQDFNLFPPCPTPPTQRPLKTGLRFSAKALRPSSRSSVPSTFS